MSAIARPFGMLLMVLYEFVKNYGVAVMLFAVIVKLIMLPFQMKSKRSTMNTTRLSPKLKELEKKHGANKAKYNEEVAKLYKEENVNPASGCLWSFLPLPIMYALYYAIRQPLTIMMGVASELLEEGGAIFEKLAEMGFTTEVSSFYEQIAQTQFISKHFESFAHLSDKLRQIDFSFLGLDLGQQPQWNFLWTADWSDSSVWLPGLALFILPILSGVSQFIATRISMKMNPSPTPEGQGGSMQTMMLLMPLFSVYIAFITPGALGLYWTFSTLLQIVQDVWLTKRYTKILEAEEAVRYEDRRIKETELEAKRIETEKKKAEGLVERNPNTSKRKKQTTEKQEQLEKASEWQKKNAPPTQKDEPGRVDNRRFARGRAYDSSRYENSGASVPEENAADAAETDEHYTPALPDRADETAAPEPVYSGSDYDRDDYDGDEDEGGDDYEDEDEE